MPDSVPTPGSLPVLERLIAFPTVSAQSNLALIDYAEGVLRGTGFEVARIADPTAPKAGLVARLGPEGPGGILLSAHSDVVPVEGQNWTRAPFRLSQQGNRLFGRGTTDMKGFLAATLALASKAAGAPLRAPLMMVISYDEEVGCKGIRQIMPTLGAVGWQPDLCIVGEPTEMRPVPGHKGKVVFHARCRGEAGHSADAPDFVNALHLAADVITALRLMQQEYARDGASDPTFAVPYSTVHAGVMRGGRILNIVPEEAVIEFELRYLPKDNPAVFKARLQKRVEAVLRGYPDTAGIDIEEVNAYPGLDISRNHSAMKLAAALAGHAPGQKVGFGTEAGFFAEAGIPTVVCGPGSMAAQGHKPDEYLETGQLLACEQMLDRVLAHLRKDQAQPEIR
ncbi:acetylornithine deacetylase [Roseinatronobacter alkalisoli]|uniref:Acetylornithine deacetylase n=1 Tax=Roseinatronobacter alkalisoli TaxID=3028235 RepID=A0ABT5TD99_9RHOB|nr:acetylornithine deacetylase [Roseinatronobacter sp. HJB301]MDD7973090.1 acetylornithine deacetylase [Roseinatronobacter sp. HJB301]